MHLRALFSAWVGGAVLLAVVSSAALAAGGRSSSGAPLRSDTVTGNWTTQDGNGVIAIEPCGDALCGRIVGIMRAPGEPIPKDVHGASQCGLTIISNERPDSDGSWLGEIIDPRSGKKYGAQIWLDEVGNLRLRGFLGLPLFGQTQTWRHFTGRVNSACEFV